jgi:hypothetical protein
MADKRSSKGGERGRRSERVLLRIPIEVKGTGADGKPFTEKTFTLVVNGDGARISLKAKLRRDDRLTITNLQTKISCPFRVVERTSDLLGEGPPEWGVECLEPEVNFWGIAFPKKAAGPVKQEWIDALLECSRCQFRELAQLALEQYRALVSQSSLTRDCAKCGVETEWGFGFVEAGPEEAIPTQPAPSAEPPSSGEGAERRRAKRVTVKLPVRIRLEDGREEIARTENLSKTGVCFASDIVMREGDVVQLTVGYTPGGNEAAIPARVVWRRGIEGSNRALYGVHLEEMQ